MDEVRLRASVGGRVLAVASPLVLVGLGSYGLARGGPGAPGLWLLVAGALLLGAALWLQPWDTRIAADGIHLRTMARRRSVSWDDVIALERYRRGRRGGGGALVVRTTRGRLAVTDHVERPDQWDELRELVGRWAPGAFVAEPPPLHPFHRQAGGGSP